LPTPANQLAVTVNGSTMKVPEGTTVSGLLKQLEIDTQMVAVEVNLDIVRKPEYMSRQLSTGDSIEIVHFVGGG
jgi:thiamine biosynthesis protein ThiS